MRLVAELTLPRKCPENDLRIYCNSFCKGGNDVRKNEKLSTDQVHIFHNIVFGALPLEAVDRRCSSNSCS